MTKRLTECERRWRRRTHTFTLCTHKDTDGVIEWLHDLVSDKCSRITGSQCDEIISNQLSGPLIFFFPHSTGPSLVADGYEEDASILERWQQNTGALSHLPPWQNKENDKCVQGGVLFSCASEERELIILHLFNVSAATWWHFSHDQWTPLLF